MEPTIQPDTDTAIKPSSKKINLIYAIIILIIIVIAATFLLKSKAIAPVTDTEITPVPVILSEENQQLNKDIDEAVTSDNENDLKQIDKEFNS